MNNIFEALRSDHDAQREIAEELLQTHGADGDRGQLFERLKTEMENHAVYEERNFYVPLIACDLTQEKARHSVAEHKELDDLVEQLEAYELSAPQWIQTAEELVHLLRHHLDEEEQEVFQLAGKVLSDKEKTDLAKAYEASMSEARIG